MWLLAVIISALCKYNRLWRPRFLLTQDTLGVLARMIAKKPTREYVAGITRNKASYGSVVEIWVGSNGLLKTKFCALGHEIHIESVVGRHIVPSHELIHIECVVVSRDVEVVTRIGRIRFNEIVGANEALRLAYKDEQ